MQDRFHPCPLERFTGARQRSHDTHSGLLSGGTSIRAAHEHIPISSERTKQELYAFRRADRRQLECGTAFRYCAGMLTVLIETHNHEEALARTLAALVPAAVEGMVREVLVCDRGSSDQTLYVAEHAGCRFIAEGGLSAGMAQARGDWLLLLQPGARPQPGWVESVSAHVARQTGAARFTRSADDRGNLLARLLRRRARLADGLLVTKRQALAVKAADSESLARAVRTQRLAAQINPARQ
ncbi:MAG: glycosyltransferase [Rhizobiaceae bacterium]